MRIRYWTLILILTVVFIISACHVAVDFSSGPSEESEAGSSIELPVQTTTYPLDHSQFRLLFDMEQLEKEYPEAYADINISGSELAIKEITPGKALLEIRTHRNYQDRYVPVVTLVLLDLNRPENYKAVVVSENKDEVYMGLRCTEDKIIVKHLDHVDTYNHQLEPIENGSVSMPGIFQKYYEERNQFHYDISNDLHEVVFNHLEKTRGKIHLYDLVNKRDKIIYNDKGGLPLFTKHDQTIIQGSGREAIYKKILLNKRGNILCEEKSFSNFTWDWTVPQDKLCYLTYLPQDSLHPKPVIATCDLTGGEHMDTIREINFNGLPLDTLPQVYISKHGLLYQTDSNELKYRYKDGVWYREETMGYYYIDFATMKARELLKYSIWNVDVDPNRDKTRIWPIGITLDGEIIVRLYDETEAGYTKIYVSNFNID